MRNSLTGRVQWLGGGILAVVVTLLFAASSSTASDAGKWNDRLGAQTKRLSLLERDRASTAARIVEARADYDAALAGFRERAASIYKAGGVDAIDALVAARGNVRRTTDLAEAMSIVARHDKRVVDRYKVAVERIPRLEREIEALEEEIAAVRRDIRRTREAIERERREAAAARERARRMARVADTPLVPRAVAAETTSASASTGISTSSGPSGYSQSGIASVYSNSFTGQPTASGEPYNPGAMTAAHRTLPLGTWVSVRGPGGTALVRINDRGPFVGGRIIDLSAASARATGVNGLAHVTITVQG